MKYNHPNNTLRRAMLEVAPKVEELSGLKAPRKKGRPVHPKIKWLDGEPWHHKYYGFYRLDQKTIFINAKWASKFSLGSVMVKAVIAHEYTHYLQDIRWSVKQWQNIPEVERLAMEVENHFLPEEYQLDIEAELTCYDKWGGIKELGYTNWSKDYESTGSQARYTWYSSIEYN